VFKKLTVILSVLALVAFLFASCTPKGTTAATESAATESAASSETAAVTEAAASDMSVTYDSPYKGIKIRFFVGGDEGDTFATVVLNGAKAAEKAFGPEVEYVFSGWNVEKMVQQLREAIASKPDGISMQGHPGEEALTPLVEEAQKNGIAITIANVDLPGIQAKYNTGYIGSIISEFGYRLGKRAIEKFGIKSGDTVIIDGNWGEPGLEKRDVGVAKAFEEVGGIKIVKIKHPPESAVNPDLFQAQVSAAVLANPEVKLISYSGGQFLGASTAYMESIGKKPGDIKNIGFDISAQIIDGFDKGYVSLTIDQEPYLQGYLAMLSLLQHIKYGFALMTVDTGVGFVDETNYKAVAELAKQGIR
jgi:simple sugar transport system substrate-binding protein